MTLHELQFLSPPPPQKKKKKKKPPKAGEELYDLARIPTRLGPDGDLRFRV